MDEVRFLGEVLFDSGRRLKKATALRSLASVASVLGWFLGVCWIARDSAKVEDQVRFLARTLGVERNWESRKRNDALGRIAISEIGFPLSDFGF